jgi:hypothetical protein
MDKRSRWLPVTAAVLAAIGAVGVAPAAAGPGSAAQITVGQHPEAQSIGDPGLARLEARCAANRPNPPWFHTLVPGFNYGSARTSLFPCARFPGSMTGQNQVKALMTSSAPYTTPFNASMRRPGEMYLYNGSTGDANPPALLTYISKVDPRTLKQVWRTNLSDARQNNELHLSGSVETLADGTLMATSDHTLYKLNATTGKIIARVDPPTGANPANDTAFNGSASFPDGTTVLKSLNRPVGCKLNGLNAIFQCPGGLRAAKPTVLSVVNPKTLKVLDSLTLKVDVSSRITATRFHGHNYLYLVNAAQLIRYVWDGHKLRQDSHFGPVTYIRRGQIGGGSPTLMGDWVILNTIGLKVPMSIVAISQADASRMTSIQPNTTLPKGQVSSSAAKPTVDPANHLIYMCDYNLGTATAIRLQHGRLSVVWQVKQRTNSFTSLIGPPNRRVFVATSIRSTVTDPTKLKAGPVGANYTEQFQWRNARTGKLLAASSYYAPTAPGDQIPPGYGGLIYDLLYDGHLVALQVQPRCRSRWA